MNKHSSPSDIAEQADASVASTEGLRADALARRRLLLKGAGTGAAAMAALAPMGALAQVKPNVFICKKNGQEFACTISGVQSAGHSFGANVNKITAGGKGISWWGTPKSTVKTSVYYGQPMNAWPQGCQAGTLVSTVFGPNAEFASTTMFALIRDYPTHQSEMARWACAYVNALAYSGTFPYSAMQVAEQYKLGSAKLKSDALALYKTYLEGL